MYLKIIYSHGDSGVDADSDSGTYSNSGHQTASIVCLALQLLTQAFATC